MLNSKSPMIDWLKRIEKKYDDLEKAFRRVVKHLIRLGILKEENKGIDEKRNSG